MIAQATDQAAHRIVTGPQGEQIGFAIPSLLMTRYAALSPREVDDLESRASQLLMDLRLDAQFLPNRV